MDGRVAQIFNSNERNESSLKRVNNALEDQNVVLNGVNLITAEEIHHIFVRLRVLDTASVEAESDKQLLNEEE